MQENNLVPTPTTPVVTPQIVVEQPKQSNFLIILLSSLLFISAVIAGFFAYQTQKLVTELTVLKNEPTPTAIAKVEPTRDPGLEPEPVPLEILTKDWKTYTNTKNKYTIKYPVTWQIKENVNDLFPAEIPPTTFLFEQVGEFAPGISIWKVPKIDPRQWITRQLYSPDYSQIKTENIVVGGISGTKISGIPGPLEQGWVFVERDGQAYIFYAGVQTELTIFDQMLSTFKFTN